MNAGKGALGCIFFFLFVLGAAYAILFGIRTLAPEFLSSDPHVIPETKLPEPAPEPAPGPLPQPAPAPQPEPAPPDPNRYERWVDSLNEFSREESGLSYVLNYGFIDHNGRTHRIRCAISKQDHQEEEDGFGYSDNEIESQLNSRLNALVNRKLTKLGLTDYAKVKLSGFGGYHCSYDLPQNLPPEEYGHINSSIAEFNEFLDTDFAKERDKIEGELYKQRGFIIRNNTIIIDHGGIVLRSQQPLLSCFQALKDAGYGYNERQYLGLYLGFFQEIRYEKPPDIRNGRKIQGLYVPTEVLINDHGDCDSKSLAFSAMIRSFGLPLMVVDLPQHVLVAVESRPGPDQKFVRIGNRYFVLCEVAGPGKFSPGEEGPIPVSGDWEYTLVEPSDDHLVRR